MKPAVSETVSNFSRRPFLRSQSSFCACQIAISLLWPPASLRHQAGPGPFYFSWLALGTLFFCSRALPAHRSGFVFFFLWPKRRLLFFFCLSCPTGKSRRFDSFQKMTHFYCLARRSLPCVSHVLAMQAPRASAFGWASGRARTAERTCGRAAKPTDQTNQTDRQNRTEPTDQL